MGKIIGLSILHGGPGPVLLAPVIVDCLSGRITAVNPCIEDIPEETLKLKIRKVS